MLHHLRCPVIRLVALIYVLFALIFFLAPLSGAQGRPEIDPAQLMSQGNYKDAFEGFKDRLLIKHRYSERSMSDFQNGVQCLIRLSREAELDDFREEVAKAYAQSWPVLQAIAMSYQNSTHFGFLISGKFERGGNRGPSRSEVRWVSSQERDRVRALQLMADSMKLLEGDNSVGAGQAFAFYMAFAEMMLGQGQSSAAWKLATLTDLTKLPDYDETQRFGFGRFGQGSEAIGAPVDDKGEPIIYTEPSNFEQANSDGQRWRWLLEESKRRSAEQANDAVLAQADFCLSQFGTQTLASFGIMEAGEDPALKTYSLQTLAEDETLAKLATGIKRFKLSPECNFISLYSEVAKSGKGGAERALGALATVFENRRQFDRAATLWKENLERFGSTPQKQDHLKQIVGNWGKFERVISKPAGTAAAFEFTFRNATSVTFEAREIDIPKLLTQLTDYIKSKPAILDWSNLDLGNIGYKIVNKKKNELLIGEAITWTENLRPRPGHLDTRTTITSKLKDAGAYLVNAKVKDGNASNIVLWINDTVIVKKRLDQKSLYFVADAVSGKQLSNVTLNFFGYRQNYLQQSSRPGYRYDIETETFEGKTDSNGLFSAGSDRLLERFQWLVTAQGSGKKLAYMGFSSVWYGSIAQFSPETSPKFFAITDRPVYRPTQTVHFKAWIGQSSYENESSFSGRSVPIEITNPRGDSVLSTTLTADHYGGVEGDLVLGDDAQTGPYELSAAGFEGGLSFRVEEYKKPEFEVKVDAPTEPVTLGDKIKATISAKYYFGAPVTQAKVHYKVTRSPQTETWFPWAKWDWLFGPGYWWAGYNYDWFPGWRIWGCECVWPWWITRPTPRPEIVMEGEAQPNSEGKIIIEIDTAPAKALHGNQDHSYEISVEVTDQSRRTIEGSGKVIAARSPFKITVWTDQGYYQTSETITAFLNARTPDSKPVLGKGELTLNKITYDETRNPIESIVQKWPVDTDSEGSAFQKINAVAAGQYRLSYVVTDPTGHKVEGGYVFVVMGPKLDSKSFRFDHIEIIPDKQEYKPGDRVKLLINTDQENSTVLLFVRPVQGVYSIPQIISLDGRSAVREIEIGKADMPNFFVEAVTVSDGKIHSQVRQIIVPPESKVLNISIKPSAQTYKPGQKATVALTLTDAQGKPFVGQTVISIYDRAVEYISGGSNVADIKKFFWSWRRDHSPSQESSIQRFSGPVIIASVESMRPIGVLGSQVADEVGPQGLEYNESDSRSSRAVGQTMEMAGGAVPAPMSAMALQKSNSSALGDEAANASQSEQPAMAQAHLRTNFADNALWRGAIETNASGEATVELTMPENLTSWLIKTWAMGKGTRVGEASTEVVTTKNLLLRLQAPRFFVERDEVVLSANIHNYLKTDKSVQAILEVDGDMLEILDEAKKTLTIKAGGEARVDFTVKVTQATHPVRRSAGHPSDRGDQFAVVRMKALSDEESDAMEMKFPVLVHGMLRTESFSSVVNDDKDSASLSFEIPEQRRVDQSRVEIRYSPSIAMALVDALPYLVGYPYGCTEQTLNRFVPTVITQNILKQLGVDLASIKEKRANLNPQEIGDPIKRAAQWKQSNRKPEEQNPVFDELEVNKMAQAGLAKLADMQLSDGGWGWFSGYGEYPSAHTTATVVHGLQVGQKAGLKVPNSMIERGVSWLKQYQIGELSKLANAKTKTNPWKGNADDLDALVHMVLVDSDNRNSEMASALYLDRNHMSVYAKTLLGMTLARNEDKDQLKMIMQNIDQFLQTDNENQASYLKLPQDNYWWNWYGSEFEANAYYLKLLSRVEPKGSKASGLAKYLLNNRKHATYWNSTRDTALVIEGLADFIKASGEGSPDMTVEVVVDGKIAQTNKITPENLFSTNNTFVLEGSEVGAGKHTVELRRKGRGNVYLNVYSSAFTLEDHIPKAGLEVKVNRKFYLLIREAATNQVPGAHGQVLSEAVEKYTRTEITDPGMLKSGDLVEVELEIESKNDYEYLIFEDMKPAGFEPVEVRSGYNGNDVGAYVEFRDKQVNFFVRQLGRGKHSVNYRVRAEIPGKFSAMPTKASAMYAPELRANSDEWKVWIGEGSLE